jgi:hypothetical protein
VAYRAELTEMRIGGIHVPGIFLTKSDLVMMAYDVHDFREYRNLLLRRLPALLWDRFSLARTARDERASGL